MSLHDDASLATVLAQLDDSTNQTWKAKRAGWAKLVRAQAAELERLRAALTELYWASDANYCDGDEKRETFERLEASQEVAVALLSELGPPLETALAPCIGRDPACPCRDGDGCHYKDAADGTKAWPLPQENPR